MTSKYNFLSSQILVPQNTHVSVTTLTHDQVYASQNNALHDIYILKSESSINSDQNPQWVHATSEA